MLKGTATKRHEKFRRKSQGKTADLLITKSKIRPGYGKNINVRGAGEL
jgi:hypothetical protein